MSSNLIEWILKKENKDRLIYKIQLKEMIIKD
jgi:hypothetical protein